MAEAKELLDRLKSIKNTDGNTYKRNKGTMTGSLIGACGGLIFGFTKKYNLISSTIVGALIGGLTAYILLPKDDTDEDE